MLSHKTHQFISKLEERCIVEPLIPSFDLDNIITAVELIQIPTGSIAFLHNDCNNSEIIVAIEGCGTISTDKQNAFIKLGEIVHTEEYTTRSLSNIDREVLRIISIRFKNLMP